MRALKLLLAAVVLSATATVPGRSEEQTKRPKPRPRKGQVVAELEQRVAALEAELSSLRRDLEAAKRSTSAEASSRQISVFRLSNAIADETAPLVQNLFGPDRKAQTTVTADTVTNSIIISADEGTIQAIEALLRKLDEAAGKSTSNVRSSATLRKKLELQAAELKAQVARAEAELKKQQNQLQYTKQMHEKGFATKLQVEAEQAAFKAAEAVLEQARLGLDALGSETSPDAESAE